MPKRQTTTLTDSTDSGAEIELTSEPGTTQLRVPGRAWTFTFKSEAEIDELRDALLDLQLAAFPDGKVVDLRPAETSASN